MTKKDAPARNPPSGLALLREPFEAHQISKLPKPTKKQAEDVRADYKKGIRCTLCGQWHHKDVVHLDYVGHAALTDRLLECDLNWNWQPTAKDEFGRPLLDGNGGMWIELTVCGQTRLGYGDAPNKRGGDAVKEVIGDALRNAAMRFGAALDLWHKGDLHAIANEDDTQGNQNQQGNGNGNQNRQHENNGANRQSDDTPETIDADQFVALRDRADEAGVDHETICRAYKAKSLVEFPANEYASAMKKLQRTLEDKAAKSNRDIDDEIPY